MMLINYDCIDIRLSFLFGYGLLDKKRENGHDIMFIKRL